MRITNKIMQENSITNININKIYQDTLTTQMSTQKKISRPSEDPVVAIRALRLRNNVTEISQYYSKNIPDAESWLSVTEDALKNLTDIVTNMITQATKGSNGDLTTADRQIILEQMQALSDEIYHTGDADYAGRYVFTGYRTDTSLSFNENQTGISYDITEQLSADDISEVTNVDTGDLLRWNSSNFSSLTGLKEQAVTSTVVHRFQLSYGSLDESSIPTIEVPGKGPGGDYVYDGDGNCVYEELGDINTNWETVVMHDYATGIPDKNDPTITYDNPYAYVAADKDAVVFIPETGELLLGDNVFDYLKNTSDEASTTVDESQIRVNYRKSNFETGDLRPEHYFYCRSTDPEGNTIEYNPSYLGVNPTKQAIEYDVGFNQTIRVNSTADECFDPKIGRTVDDLKNALNTLADIEKTKNNIEESLKSASGSDKDTLQAQLDAAGKAYTLAKDKVQSMFENAITKFQGFLDDANLCITNCGTRSKKLELIQTRMQSQKTTFETLKSENEDVDITEVAIQLSSAELTYEASLMATSKIMQTTLLNFI
ncbi:MAG: hypothetical protein J6033_02150 [Lachnospiraceae bacterium]|nr:hypothetical protein [Lachnospiraceae bacterium]